MKPGAFIYHAPTTLDGALALLAENSEDGKILAGGQSLVPAMNFRLARPSVLIDINRIPGLDEVGVEGGYLCLGARTRHATFETMATDRLGRLLALIAGHIAHAPIRTRGTIGGSLSHADPAAEWCTTVLALQGVLVVRSMAGERQIPADAFFSTVFTTALQPDEILTEIRLPLRDQSWRFGFAEFSRRAGDFALAMAVVGLQIEAGTITQASVGLGGVAYTPLLSPAASAILVGRAPEEAVFAQAAAAAAAATDPPDDLHASGPYRRELVGAMVRRALRGAIGG
jgi:carbon-monoxide dehydrogenase medium subunit